MSHRNGSAKSQAFTRRVLPNYYSPQPIYHWHPALRRGRYRPFYDTPAMLLSPAIRIGLTVIGAPIHSARWEVKSPSNEVKRYVDTTLKTFWRNDLGKALEMIPWGTAAGILDWKWDDRNDLVFYENLRDLRLQDVLALRADGGLSGMKIVGGVNLADSTTLRAPRTFWAPYRARYGRLYGSYRLESAWGPWMEHSAPHGAVAIRQLWTFKNAFNSGIMYYPEGTYLDPEGNEVDTQQYARQQLAYMDTGATVAFPGASDDKGNRLWEYVTPQMNGDFKQLLDYPKALEEEVWMGMGILPEVVRAAEVGGGWSGRSVPFLSFLQSEDEVVNDCIKAADRCVVAPGVKHNFGERARYEIVPVSLVPKSDPYFAGDKGNGGDSTPPGAQPPDLQRQSAPRATGGNPQSIIAGAAAAGPQPVKLSMAEEALPRMAWEHEEAGMNIPNDWFEAH